MIKHKRAGILLLSPPGTPFLFLFRHHCPSLAYLSSYSYCVPQNITLFTLHDVWIDKMLWIHVFSCTSTSSTVDERNGETWRKKSSNETCSILKWHDQISKCSSFESGKNKQQFLHYSCKTQIHDRKKEATAEAVATTTTTTTTAESIKIRKCVIWKNGHGWKINEQKHSSLRIRRIFRVR